MPIPPSVTKMKNGNVEFTSNVDRVNYTLDELTRAALRDCVNLFVILSEEAIMLYFQEKKVMSGVILNTG